MFRIEVIDGVATMVPRDAPAPVAETEVKLEVREISQSEITEGEISQSEITEGEIDDWEQGLCHRLVKGRKASRKVVVPARMSAGGIDLYSSWIFDDDGTEYEEPKWEEPPDYVPTGDTDSEEEEDEEEEEEEKVTPYQAEPASTSIPVGAAAVASFTTKYTKIFSHFYNDRIKEQQGGVMSKTDIYHIFVKWQKENDIEDVPLGQLWWYLDERFLLVRGIYRDLGIKWKAGERRLFQAEKMKQVKSGVNMDKLIEETSWIDEYTKNQAHLIQKKVYGEEPLLEIVEKGDMKIYRHPEYTMYGGDLKTGKIYKLKRNHVEMALDTQVDKGITLSLGVANGRRLQKNMKTSQFIADCGKLEKPSEFHKVKVDKLHTSFITRPSPMFYPFDCLSYEYKNEIVKELVIATGKNKDISGARLVGTLKSSTEIENYITRLKEQYIAELKKKDDEIKKKDAQIKKLETENVRLQQDCISPLKAGAIQLQELLMTEHQGSTVLEMLQFCFKDITRNYPKTDDDERSDAETDFGLIFEMSPRGLPDRNEIITR